jgi:TRAP-type uncharacterized transport system substrate-binding protein
MRHITRRHVSGLIAGLLPSVALPRAGLAQSAPVRRVVAPAGSDEVWAIPNRDKINAGTVTVITAPAGGATSIFGSDMARVLDDDQSGLRVLPVLGKGPVRNVIDILYLKTIDMGAVTAEVPEFYRLQYGINDISSRLRYIAKLYNNEVHLVAKTSIKSIFDLEGKHITAQTDVGYYSAKVICTRLGINATFDYRTDDAKAVQNIADGTTDAYVTSTGKVFSLLRNIKNEDRALHLVTVPYDKRLRDMYLPTTLTSEDYPNLLARGEQVDTVATSVLLAVFNWPTDTERYARVAKFVDAFFSKIDEFQKPPRHPKWRESSIGIVVPGWTRFKAAQDWLDANTAGKTAQAEFVSFMERNGKRNVSPEETERLYREFLAWSKKRGR